MDGQPLAFLSLEHIGDTSAPGHASAFLVLLAFLLSFIFIRTSARMNRAQISWWPGSVETRSGVHLHHLVWGITLMLVSGFSAFAITAPSWPWYEIASITFGIGAGLTFDEFALWVHLEDVYWEKQGRDSLDAVVLVTVFMGLVVLGFRPFGLEGQESSGLVVFAIIQALVLSVITLLKGRIALGLISVFIPGVGLWGALRLGKPNSPWAHQVYSEAKIERAKHRFPENSRNDRIRAWLLNLIGGRTTAGRVNADDRAES